MDFLRGAALAIPRLRRLVEHRDNLLKQLAAKERLPPGPAASPFFHYHAAFDPIAVTRRHAAPGLLGHKDFLTNYLGVRIRPAFLPTVIGHRAGEVEGTPIPANWHADVAEWGAALRAVEAARGTFTAVELGCGWGCWMNNTGVAARRAGLRVRLVGVEADRQHLALARTACADNGFAGDEVVLHHGVAAARGGTALFPRQAEEGDTAWGLEPVFDLADDARAVALASGRYDEVPVVAFDEVVAAHRRVDLLHMDIQGGEADWVEACLATCTSKVAYLVVGTHSRLIEGRLIDVLGRAGWHLEIERPAMLTIADGMPRVRVDGVQGWCNPKLPPAEAAASAPDRLGPLEAEI